MEEKMKIPLNNKVNVFFFCYFYFVIAIFIVLIGGKYLIRVIHGIYHVRYLIEVNDIGIVFFIPIIISFTIVWYHFFLHKK